VKSGDGGAVGKNIITRTTATNTTATTATPNNKRFLFVQLPPFIITNIHFIHVSDFTNSGFTSHLNALE
jgi:hypothetical protein